MASSIGTYKPTTTKQTTPTAAVGVYKPGVLTTLGAKATSPEQNLKAPDNTLKPSQQVKSPAPQTTFTDEQNKGLLAALERKNSGKANETDTKNLDYAISKGWKAPVNSPSGVVTSQSGKVEETTVQPVEKPVDISQQGILTRLLGENLTSKNSQTAQDKLLELSANNPATSGVAMQNYNKAVSDLAQLDQEYAAEKSKMSADPNLSLQFKQGREQILDQQYAARRAALQGAVNNQRDAIGQQISGYQAQQTGFGNVGTLANTGLGLAQSGISTALGATTPKELSGGSYLVNPVTGQPMQGSSMAGIPPIAQQDIENLALQLATASSGLSYDQAYQQLSGYGPVAQNALLSEILKYNPNFNVTQSNAQAKAQEASTIQTGTRGGEVSKAATTAKKALDVLETAYKGLSDLQKGGIPASIGVYNWVAEKLGDQELSSYQSILHDARAQLAGVLASTGASTPTGAEQTANAYLPDNMTAGQFKEKLEAARKLIDDKVSSWTSSESYTPSSSNATTGTTSSGIGYTIITE